MKYVKTKNRENGDYAFSGVGTTIQMAIMNTDIDSYIEEEMTHFNLLWGKPDYHRYG